MGWRGWNMYPPPNTAQNTHTHTHLGSSASFLALKKWLEILNASRCSDSCWSCYQIWLMTSRKSRDIRHQRHLPTRRIGIVCRSGSWHFRNLWLLFQMWAGHVTYTKTRHFQGRSGPMEVVLSLDGLVGDTACTILFIYQHLVHLSFISGPPPHKINVEATHRTDPAPTWFSRTRQKSFSRSKHKERPAEEPERSQHQERQAEDHASRDS